ncbi:MAG TPA: carboxy-S-adenosyl-L-methionine synthase CmoA [Alphaproteobacteria bacterium]|jgi:tRNA (cmo5U34)-methyltransferase|nr:carboxy-S-adenosyl-L-methionine synthase CmoA [Alphaproteobacteria bacterium]
MAEDKRLASIPSLKNVKLDTPADTVFAEVKPQSDFKFGDETVRVFDDMVSRSVPFYDEMQRMTAELAGSFAQAGSALYDLGCSTATTLALLHHAVDPGVRFVGVDNSPQMLAKAREKLDALGITRPVDLVLSDIEKMPPLHDASVVVMNLTLQFVRPLHRERLVRQIFDGMLARGCFILIEKLTVSDSDLNRLFINYYYDLKRRNGYSELEISQKREALENVLIPYRLEENVELLKGAGFRSVEMFFRWYNFCGMVAVK